jgi:putative FmdB family regulatory protein
MKHAYLIKEKIMPHYDYQCTQCSHRLEAFQKITDAPLQECPVCHQKSLKRGPGGGIGLIFQGSGFYATDYSSKGQASSDSKQTSSPHSASKSCCPCGSSSPCSS